MIPKSITYIIKHMENWMGINKHSLETRILTIIPYYNEEVTIGNIVIKTKRYVDTIAIIDDGDNDDTVKIVQDAGVVLIIGAIVMFIGLILNVPPDVIKSSKGEKNFMIIIASYY